MGQFKILPAKHGSGWVGLHVAVDTYFRTASLAETTEICLTSEAINPEEFDRLVDELIDQLLALKAVARRKLAKGDNQND